MEESEFSLLLLFPAVMTQMTMMMMKL